MLDLTEALVFALETDKNGIRFIHFYGYGYDTHGEGFRFLHYHGFAAKLEDALKVGIEQYEDAHGSVAKCSVEDADEYESMADIYLGYNNGKPPILIRHGRIDMATPDGIYLLC